VDGLEGKAGSVAVGVAVIVGDGAVGLAVAVGEGVVVCVNVAVGVDVGGGSVMVGFRFTPPPGSVGHGMGLPVESTPQLPCARTRTCGASIANADIPTIKRMMIAFDFMNLFGVDLPAECFEL
jgi:hypothetical protein